MHPSAAQIPANVVSRYRKVWLRLDALEDGERGTAEHALHKMRDRYPGIHERAFPAKPRPSPTSWAQQQAWHAWAPRTLSATDPTGSTMSRAFDFAGQVLGQVLENMDEREEVPDGESQGARMLAQTNSKVARGVAGPDIVLQLRVSRDTLDYVGRELTERGQDAFIDALATRVADALAELL